MQNVIFDRIKKNLDSHDIVLYLKGTAMFPLCGFSAAAVQILTELEVPFKDINVLEDPDIREGIKQYADWPTIPQLYIKGEFVGGCDLIRQMYAEGELQELLINNGFKVEQAA